MTDYKNLENIYGLNIYPKRNVVLIRGEGARVWDDEGNEYIDCVGGHGVANIGHSNKQVVQAISDQAKKLITCPGTFYNDQRALLMKKLVELTPGNLEKVFLCNSGTESVEAALKFARFTTKKTEFICAMRGYHGRTMGALSATFKLDYRKDFQPLVPGFSFAPFNQFEKLAEKVNENTAAVILEVIQGEGGVNIGNEDYFQNVRKLCDENRILLIIDEVQTGFCRTGEMFAIDHFGLQPDMLCLAKSIAGGLPMGALVCSSDIEIPIGKHGTTFGGNPLVCAAANAALDFMREAQLAKQAKGKGDYLIAKLQSHNLTKVRDLRYKGLMVGLELKEKVKPFVLELLELGLLVLPAGATVIRLLPPLTIEYDELDKVYELLVKVLSE